MAYSKQCVLLDFDGVVLRSPAASALIRDRCELYLSARTGITNKATLRNLNESLYTTHGHTAIGLGRMMHQKMSVCAFNETVYDNIDYSSLRDRMHDTDFDKALIDSLCAEHENVYIFSNARADWVYNICSAFSYNLNLVNARVLDVSDYFLKPDPAAYDLAETVVGQQTGIIFIDDTPMNIRAAPGHWHTRHFCRHGSSALSKQSRA